MAEKIRQRHKTHTVLRPKGGRGQKATLKKTGKKTKIQTPEVYETVMNEIDALLKKGEKNLSQSELSRLQTLAEAAELYEDTSDPLPLPSKLPDMIRMKMFQLRLNQHFAAKLLGISEAKFSLIMNGKQKPDINFIKALHEKFKIDAEALLQAL